MAVLDTKKFDGRTVREGGMTTFEKLRELLEYNYCLLGWSLDDFHPYKIEGGHRGHDAHCVVIILTCPCGGSEQGQELVYDEDDPFQVAKRILRGTCSREHLEDDVARGVLQAVDLEKHVFTGVVKLPEDVLVRGRAA